MKDTRPPGGVFEPHAAPASAVDPQAFHAAKREADEAALTPAQRRERARAERRAAKTPTPAADPAPVTDVPSAPAAPTPAILDRKPKTVTGPTPPNDMKPGVRYCGGYEVIADEVAEYVIPAGFGSKPGRTVQWPRVRKLLLADDREVYGCAECEYWAPRITSVRPHLNAHSTKKADTVKAAAPKAAPKAPVVADPTPAPTTPKEPAVAAAPTIRIVPAVDKQAPAPRVVTPSDLSDLTLREIAVRLAQQDQREEKAQRDIAEWRRRALAAEKQVESIRQALSAAGLRLDVG